MPNMTLTKTPMPEQAPDVRNKNFKEVSLGYTEEMAVNEAKRCLQCKNHPEVRRGLPRQHPHSGVHRKGLRARFSRRLRGHHLHECSARPVRPCLPAGVPV